MSIPRLSVIIPTRNRPEQLRQLMRCLAAQRTPPAEIFIIDASDTDESEKVVHMIAGAAGLPVSLIRSGPIGSARQRNLGLDAQRQSRNDAQRHSENDAQRGEFVVFLDDDVTFDEHFLGNLIAPMLSDPKQTIGGTLALITNELGGPFSRRNRAVLRLVLGCDPAGAEGRLIGPAFAMPFLSAPSGLAPVEWMNGCCAYRAAALGNLRFREHFSGYSAMEDVDLSYRVSRNYQLLAVPTARLVHLGMGSISQPDWFRDGQQRIINRHFVLRHAMGDRRVSSLLRLLALELLYIPLACLRVCVRKGSWRKTCRQIAGRYSGALQLAIR